MSLFHATANGNVPFTPEEELAWNQNLPTLTDIKSATWERIKAERDRRKTTGGFQCAGKWFHSDDRSLSHHFGNKDTARDQLEAGGVMADPLMVNGSQLPWKTMDGTWLPLTCQLAFDIVLAGKNSEAAIHQAAEIHRVTMESSADPASYDFSTGWPAVFGE